MGGEKRRNGGNLSATFLNAKTERHEGTKAIFEPQRHRDREVHREYVVSLVYQIRI